MDHSLIAEAFLTSKAARKLSARTLASYRQQIMCFLDACGELPVDPEPVEAFLSGLHVARNTQRNYHRTIAALYKYAAQRFGHANPMPMIQPPRKERTVKTRPTPADVRRMFHAARHSTRDTILLTLLFDTGCRVGELIHIRVEDIKGDLLRIPRQGKTGERWVPLPPDIPRLLHSAGITRGFMVANTRTGAQLTVIGAERAYQRLAAASGLSRDLWGPHSARRYAATEVNRKRGLSAAMTMLGHQDPRTTMAYLDTSADALLPTWKTDRPLAGVTSITQAYAAAKAKTRLRFRFELFPDYSYRALARLIGVSHQQLHGARAGYWGIGRKFINGALLAFPQYGFWELFEEVTDPDPLSQAA